MIFNATKIVGKIFLLGVVMIFLSCTGVGWQERLDSAVSLYGHRNWIIIADSAYPKQNSPGIETVVADADHLEVLDLVLDKVAAAPHVRANVMLDTELDSVPEDEAPGITAYRKLLKNRLQGKDVKTMPHEDIIASLDKSATLFNVLIIKTNMTLPYTSVFLQLDCGYWNAQQEKELRDKIEQNLQ